MLNDKRNAKKIAGNTVVLQACGIIHIRVWGIGPQKQETMFCSVFKLKKKKKKI